MLLSCVVGSTHGQNEDTGAADSDDDILLSLREFLGHTIYTSHVFLRYSHVVMVVVDVIVDSDLFLQPGYNTSIARVDLSF